MNINDTPYELLEMILTDMYIHNGLISKSYTKTIKLKKYKSEDEGNPTFLAKNCFYNNHILMLLYMKRINTMNSYAILNNIQKYCVINNNITILKKYIKYTPIPENDYSGMGAHKCCECNNYKLLKWFVAQYKNGNIKIWKDYGLKYYDNVFSAIIEQLIANICRLKISKHFIMIKYLYPFMNEYAINRLHRSKLFETWIIKNSNNTRVKEWVKSINYVKEIPGKRYDE